MKHDLPKGWRWTTCGETAAPERDAIIDGPFGSKLKTEHYTAAGARVIRLGNIQPMRFADEDRAYISLRYFKELIAHEVQSGDLLIAALGDPLGRACRAPANLGPALVKADCLRYRSASSVDPDYLVYWLNSPDGRANIESLSHGIGRKRINTTDLRRIAVPMPPVREQADIVRKLASLFKRTKMAGEELTRIPRLAERYKEAILGLAFRGELTAHWRDSAERKEAQPWSLPTTWTWRRISEVAEVASNLIQPSEVPNLPHIAPNHIESGIPRLLPFKTVKEDAVTSAKHRFFPGQIIYSKIRPYLRKAVIVDFEGVCSADMYPINARCDSRYLLWWLLSPGFNHLAMEHQGRTVLPKINQNALYSIPIPVPPTEEQVEIARCIDAAFERMDAVKSEIGRAADLLDRLGQATLAKAFRGELVRPEDFAETESLGVRRRQR
jgi:type I restriction enzyme, S subunit